LSSPRPCNQQTTLKYYSPKRRENYPSRGSSFAIMLTDSFRNMKLRKTSAAILSVAATVTTTSSNDDTGVLMIPIEPRILIRCPLYSPEHGSLWYAVLCNHRNMWDDCTRQAYVSILYGKGVSLRRKQVLCGINGGASLVVEFI